jgi:hypothetical protein
MVMMLGNIETLREDEDYTTPGTASNIRHKDTQALLQSESGKF